MITLERSNIKSINDKANKIVYVTFLDGSDTSYTNKAREAFLEWYNAPQQTPYFDVNAVMGDLSASQESSENNPSPSNEARAQAVAEAGPKA